jgi:hypothetical protein
MMQSRPLTRGEKKKQHQLFNSLKLLNKAVRGYSFVAAHDKQDPRHFTKDNLHFDMIRDDRAVAQLRSVPMGVLKGLTEILDKAHLPYTCDTESIEAYRKRALIYVDIASATQVNVYLTADALIDEIQKISGKNFSAVMRKITPRGNGEMIGLEGGNVPGGDVVPERNFQAVPPEEGFLKYIKGDGEPPKEVSVDHCFAKKGPKRGRTFKDISR